jgi:hypothetical protein
VKVKVEKTDSSSATIERQSAVQECPALWTSRVQADGIVPGGISYHADIFRDGVFMCRISLAGKFCDLGAAEEALGDRLDAWISEYESRSHTGTTAFQEL